MSTSTVQQQAFRTRDAAIYLGISTRKLASLTRPHGPIQSVKIGRTLHYRLEELQRVLEQGTDAMSDQEATP